MVSEMISQQLILEKHHRFTWKINTFVSIKTLGREVRTNVKMGSGIGLPYDCDWTFFLLRSSKSPYLDTFQIVLSNQPSNLKEINASFRIQIKTFKQDDILYYDSKFGPFVNMVEQNWECKLIGPNFIEYLPLDQDGNLEVDIVVTIQPPKYKTIDEMLSKFQGQFIEKLQFDLANMLNISSSSCPDFTTVILSKFDSAEFPVHLELLASRSNVFLRMLESNKKDGPKRIVEVTEVSSAVLKIILHFLYTGTLLENWKTVSTEELVFAAASYEIHDLLEFLDEVVGQICTMENAGKLMRLARKMKLKRAEKDLFTFIKISSESFDQFEKFMVDSKSYITSEKSLKSVPKFHLWE